MILEIDCGNTRIKWRLRCGNEISERGSFSTVDDWKGLAIAEAARSSIVRVLVSSVLGDEHRKKLVAWSLTYLNVDPEFAQSEQIGGGITNGYQRPDTLGVDRWLSILAARAQSDQAYIVVDCGSAITVDVITSQGEHLGGYIAPGLKLMREALTSKTTAINLSNIGHSDNAFPGRNTVQAIKSAELAMITGLIVQAKMILSRYGANDSLLWITGGDGEWLSGMIANGRFVQDLVLDGLSIALTVQDPLRKNQ